MRKILHDVVRFDSFEDFLDQVSLAPTPAMRRAWGTGDARALASETGTLKFTGTSDYASALTLARTGWPEGRAQMGEQLDALTPYVQALGVMPHGGYDVAGYAPCVPLFNAGSPACMLTMGETFAQTSRVVRFCLSMSIQWSVPAEHIRNRGAAVLAVVEYLEAIGLRCQIELAHCVSDSDSRYNDSETGATIYGDCDAINEAYIPVKQPAESIELDRLAFMLGHPSVLRRFVFRLDEQHVAAGHAMKTGYGMPRDIKPDPDQVYLPAMQGSGRAGYSTPDSALKTVLGLVKAKLSEEQQARFGEDWKDLLTDSRIA